MVDVGTVTGDLDSVDSNLKNYGSLVNGLGEGWEGVSHDSFENQANAFVNEYSSKISSQMVSFCNAVAYYKEYETLKETIEIYEYNYNEAVKAKDEPNIKKYADECEKCKKRLEEVKAKIKAFLSAVIGGTSSPATVSGSGTSSSNTSSSTSKSNTGKWSNYKDAVAAGFSNIMTKDEFARSKSEYNTYQDYLDAMYDKYVTNAVTYKPVIMNGNFDTRLKNNGLPVIWNTAKYDGEYVEFENKDGIKVRAPLAIAKYENGEIVYKPMTDEQKEDYINKLTTYYNDIMENTSDYSDKFKNETGDRVDSLTFVYIDPASREKIDSVNGYSAYCSPINGLSNHSDVVVCTDMLINFDDSSSWYNTDEAYDYMLETYTHELGHAYANDRFIAWDRDDTYVWNQIYDTVTSDPTNKDILRDYSMKNKNELFADSTAYYYTDPDKLKQVEINFEMPEFNMKYDTLYDYMDYILN